MDYEKKIGEYLGMDVVDVATDLRNYTETVLKEMKKVFLSDIIGEGDTSPDLWLVKLINKEISKR